MTSTAFKNISPIITINVEQEVVEREKIWHFNDQLSYGIHFHLLHPGYAGSHANARANKYPSSLNRIHEICIRVNVPILNLVESEKVNLIMKTPMKIIDHND